MATDVKNLIDETIDETVQQYLHFKIKGKTALLMHNPAGSMTVTTDAPKRGKDIPTPEVEAERGTYRMSDGNLCVPAPAVRNCILNGAKGLKVGARAAGPYVSGSLLLMDEHFPLTDENEDPIEDYIIDTRRVVIKGAGIMRSRAMIEVPWYITGRFLYNDVASVEVIRRAFQDGELTMGLLDYRIEKKGPYGSFTVEELEII